MWVIRVWEEQAPEGEELLEWLLLTSAPTSTLEDAWEGEDWYAHRWLVEDYHQCLKSGCCIEQLPLQTVDGLMRRLGAVVPACRAEARRCGRWLGETQNARRTRSLSL